VRHSKLLQLGPIKPPTHHEENFVVVIHRASQCIQIAGVIKIRSGNKIGIIFLCARRRDTGE